MTEKFDNSWAIILSKYPLLFKDDLIKKKVKAIIQLEHDANPIYEIPFLFPILLGNEPDAVKNQAAESISILFDKLMINNNNVVSKSMFRSIYITVDQISSLLKFKYSNILLGIASLNENGFVREAALDQCLVKNAHMPYSFLLPRINDNVPSIREKAKKLFRLSLPLSSLENILRNCDAFIYYANIVPIQHMDLITKISQIIRKTPFSTFISAFEDYSPASQKIILMSFLTDFRENLELFSTILKKILPSVKKWFMTKTQYWDLPESIISKLLSDSNSVIRQSAIRRIKPEKIGVSREKLMEMTYDPSRRVRETARFVLRSEEMDKIHSNYCYLIENNENPSYHLMEALMEIATIDDLDRIKKYLSHANKFVRASALKSLYRLLERKAIDSILQGLVDRSSLVRKVSASILKASSPIHDEQIRSYLFNGPIYLKKTCFGILISKNRNKYSALLDILKVLLSKEDTLIEQAFGALKHWSMPSYIFPDRALYENIIQHISLVEELYPSFKNEDQPCKYYWYKFKKKIELLEKIVR